MIRPSYTLKLARTKLRSRRGMLITSVIVASLLFGASLALVIVFAGAEKSASEFIKKAGNDRYLAKVSPYIPHEKVGFTNPPSLETIREIKNFEEQYYGDLRKKYESYGLDYEETSEIPSLTPSAWASEALPEEQRVIVNWASPVIEAMRTRKFEEYSKTATNKLGDLKKLGAKYRAEGYYIVNKQGSLPTLPGLRLVQDGKEDFSDSEIKGGDSTTYGYYTYAIHNGLYSFTDQRLLGRYLLNDGANLMGIPVIVSAQEAAALFGKDVGVGEEPEAASEKRVWLQKVQESFNGYTYSVCFRNSAELALLEKIQRDYADIKNNENTEGYQKPSLIYNNPAEPCGEITVGEDTRSVAEKHADDQMEETQKKLGTYIAPKHRLLTFQIVGIKYAQPYLNHTNGVDEYIKSLLVSQDESATLDIPLQMYESLPDELKIDDLQTATVTPAQQASDDFVPRVLEFKTVDDARAFLDNETCPSSETNCSKQFFASTYGSNYLILDEIGGLLNRIARVAFPAVIGLATVIFWFTVSRIMTENRKETAIYRAMGAKRRDVTAIYLTYVLLVALWIVFVSLSLGIMAALASDYFYGQILSDTAATAFGIVDSTPRFSLFHIKLISLLFIAGSILAISLFASILQLIRNVRSIPIQYMR